MRDRPAMLFFVFSEVKSVCVDHTKINGPKVFS